MSGGTPIRVLFLEDQPADYRLCLLELQAAHMDIEARRVASKQEFQNALASSPPDIVLADYRLPSWSGLDALRLMQSMQIDIPLIVVTGSLGDEVAAQCIKQGATDYVVKDRLARLPVAIRQALQERKMRQELRETQLRHEGLVQHAPVGIFRSSVKEDRFLAVNPALVEMLGYDSAEALMRVKISQDIYLQASDRKTLLEASQQRDLYLGIEVKWKRKDGTPITARLSGRSIRLGDEVVGHDVFAEDVTNLQSLERQLQQSQKMEAIGRLAGGIAHDFNNLLMVVNGYAEIIKDRSSDQQSRIQAEKILSAGTKAGSLTRQLLAFSRRQILEPVVLNLNDLVTELCKFAPRIIGEDVQLIFAPDSQLGLIKADPSQIEQVIMNLLVNSRDAMPNGGRLTIETSRVELDTAYSKKHFGVPPGEYSMLAVSDTGIGMSADTQARIFEPFFTTKESGKGTGLGLATVYGIVKQSGGYIWVYSEPFKGTTFKIYFPRVTGKAEPLPAHEAKPVTGSGAVLVIEDEQTVREMVCEMLETLGYKAIEVGNADQAMSLVQENQQIDAVMVDLILPGVGGPEIVARIRKARPQLPVIFMSGYSDRASQVQELGPDALFLQKPFSVAALGQKISKALDRRA